MCSPRCSNWLSAWLIIRWLCLLMWCLKKRYASRFYCANTTVRNTTVKSDIFWLIFFFLPCRYFEFKQLCLLSNSRTTIKTSAPIHFYSKALQHPPIHDVTFILTLCNHTGFYPSSFCLEVWTVKVPEATALIVTQNLYSLKIWKTSQTRSTIVSIYRHIKHLHVLPDPLSAFRVILHFKKSQLRDTRSCCLVPVLQLVPNLN